jgi:hypothetical protein
MWSSDRFSNINTTMCSIAANPDALIRPPFAGRPADRRHVTQHPTPSARDSLDVHGVQEPVLGV